MHRRLQQRGGSRIRPVLIPFVNLPSYNGSRDGSKGSGLLPHRMWKVRETSIVPEDYTCERCIQQQLLTDSVRELQLVDWVWVCKRGTT